MDAVELLLKRASALRLTEPGPSGAELATLLDCAVHAPDHGRLRPWRFVVIRGAGLDRFGNLLADACRQESPAATVEQLDRERAKAKRAPVVIAVAASINTAHKVPAIEQILATGGAALTVMLAANALGYGTMWKTGAPAYSAVVKSALGLVASDAIVGFIYVGTPVGGPSPASRAEASSCVTYWD